MILRQAVSGQVFSLLVLHARKFSDITLCLYTFLEDVFPPCPAGAFKTKDAPGTSCDEDRLGTSLFF